MVHLLTVMARHPCIRLKRNILQKLNFAILLPRWLNAVNLIISSLSVCVCVCVCI